jgi:hypothetical protein
MRTLDILLCGLGHSCMSPRHTTMRSWDTDTRAVPNQEHWLYGEKKTGLRWIRTSWNSWSSHSHSFDLPPSFFPPHFAMLKFHKTEDKQQTKNKKREKKERREERLVTSRRRHVIQGPDTSSRVLLQVQGRDTSSRCRLTGARHTMSLPPTRVQCPLCAYPSANFLPSPIQSVFPIPSESFFSLFDSPYSSLYTLWHISVRGLRT